ncbi:unnamed protein product [Paramecium sonneborni]|uniref:Uncharacterized protein n=1 Tax=Paramecium sonneborni TaxID=65129 RepID=A0A8S1RPW1_9CILI|nr:unnamed protein product [Paramecium sonneborni]
MNTFEKLQHVCIEQVGQLINAQKNQQLIQYNYIYQSVNLSESDNFPGDPLLTQIQILYKFFYSSR